MTKKKDNQAFSQLYLAKALEGEVQGWVDQGWPGVTQTTLELFHYWFQRGEDVEERFYDCQRRAIETVVYCYEILKSKSLFEVDLPCRKQEKTIKKTIEETAEKCLSQNLP